MVLMFQEEHYERPTMIPAELKRLQLNTLVGRYTNLKFVPTQIYFLLILRIIRTMEYKSF